MVVNCRCGRLPPRVHGPCTPASCGYQLVSLTLITSVIFSATLSISDATAYLSLLNPFSMVSTTAPGVKLLCPK